MSLILVYCQREHDDQEYDKEHKKKPGDDFQLMNLLLENYWQQNNGQNKHTELVSPNKAIWAHRIVQLNQIGNYATEEEKVGDAEQGAVAEQSE